MRGQVSHTIFSAAAFLIVTTSARAQLHTVDYNNPGDLAANFSLNDNGAGNRYTEVATGGLGNSRAIGMLNTIDQAGTSAVYNQGSYNFATPGHAVTVSHFFHRIDATNTNFAFSIPQLGILTDTNELFGANIAGPSYASLRLLNVVGSATNVQLQTEVKSGTGTRQGNTIPGTAALVAGDWYRMVATIRMLSANQVRITGALENWGPTGAAFVSNVMQLTNAQAQSLVTLTGSDFVTGDSAVWAGWRAFPEGGISVVDNFRSVPEPTSMALLAAAGLFLRRRRTA